MHRPLKDCQKLLERFKYPWEMMPLMYAILKNAHADIDEASKRIDEGTRHLRGRRVSAERKNPGSETLESGQILALENCSMLQKTEKNLGKWSPTFYEKTAWKEEEDILCFLVSHCIVLEQEMYDIVIKYFFLLLVQHYMQILCHIYVR
ncbi:unnamed protein product, partial [Callosobruchus maculatus]